MASHDSAESNGAEKANPTKDAPSPKQPAAPALRIIQLVAVLTVTGILGAGAYHYFYAVGQQQYLAARNARALSSVSAQIEGSLASLDKLLSGLEKDLKSASLVPALEHVSVVTSNSTRKRGQCASAASHDPNAVASPYWTRKDGGDPSCLHRTLSVPAFTRLVDWFAERRVGS